eukprot:179158_1
MGRFIPCPCDSEQDLGSEHQCLWLMFGVMGVFLVVSIYMIYDAFRRKTTQVPRDLRLVRWLNFLYILCFELDTFCRIFDQMVLSVIFRNMHRLAADIALVAFMMKMAEVSVKVQLKTVHRLHNLITYWLVAAVTVVQIVYTVLMCVMPSQLLFLVRQATAVLIWFTLVTTTATYLVRVIRVVKAHINEMKRSVLFDSSDLNRILTKFSLLTAGIVASWLYYLVYVCVMYESLDSATMLARTPIRTRWWSCGVAVYMLFVPVIRWCMIAYYAHVPWDAPETQKVVALIEHTLLRNHMPGSCCLPHSDNLEGRHKDRLPTIPHSADHKIGSQADNFSDNHCVTDENLVIPINNDSDVKTPD